MGGFGLLNDKPGQSFSSSPLGPRGGGMQDNSSTKMGPVGFGIDDLKQRVENRTPTRFGRNSIDISGLSFSASSNPISESINDVGVNGVAASRNDIDNRGFNSNSIEKTFPSRQGEIRLETNVEAERIRADKRARRLEQARMEGIEEVRMEEQRRRKAEEARSQQKRVQAEARARMEAEKNMSETKKYEAVNKAIAVSDDNYKPPQNILDSKSLTPLLEQVDGPSLLKFDGKEATYSGRGTKIYGGSTLDIPIRVSAPGSIIEYSIEKKSYDFGLGIVAKLDQGGTTVVKPMSPFDGKDVVADRPRQKTQSDQVLVGAGSVPCTLNFKFENRFSWITEVTYKIRVIPPSTELLLAGRRRRATASMQALENDISQTNTILNEVYNQGSILQTEVDTLTQQVEYMESNLQQTREDEWNIRNMEETGARPTSSSSRF
jgi:hypothetical protein